MNGKAKTLAIIALVLGILSGILGLFLALLGYAAAVAAVILAIVALVKYRKGFWTGSEKRTITACSLIGIITAVLGFTTSFVSGILGALLKLGLIELPF